MRSARPSRPQRRAKFRVARALLTLVYAMKTFILSSSGRILALAFGIALAGSGVSKLMDGTAGLAVGSIAVLITIALAVFALATAVEEHGEAATLTIVLLPWLAFLGEIGLGLMPRSGAGLLVIAGVIAVAFGALRRTAPEQHSAGFSVVRSA